MVLHVLSRTADLTNDHWSAMAWDCIAALLYTTIWEVIVGLHFVQDVMIWWCFTEPTINLFIYPP